MNVNGAVLVLVVVVGIIGGQSEDREREPGQKRSEKDENRGSCVHGACVDVLLRKECVDSSNVREREWVPALWLL